MSFDAASANWIGLLDTIEQRWPMGALGRDPLRSQARLLALLGSAAPLPALLDALATYVETWAEDMLCAVMLVDPSGRMLLPGSGPSLPESYVRAIGAVPIGETQGSCGTAAARREMVIVDDVERSDLWAAYAPVAIAHELRACWSVPMLDDQGALLGTLALYYRARKSPGEAEIELIRFAAGVAACMIQRHRDAERLRSSEARLAAAVWGTQIGLWESSSSGECLWLNDWAGRFAANTADARGTPVLWRGRMHPEDVDRYEHADDACTRNVADHYEAEYRIRDVDEHWRWIHERGMVKERASDGTPLRFVGVCIDIDARKRMESELLHSAQDLAIALWGAQSAYWTTDLLANVTEVSDSFFAMTGITRADWNSAKEPWCTRVHEDDAPMGCARFRAHLEGRTDAYEHEYRILTPKGWLWLLDRGRVVARDPTGRPLRISGTSTDVSSRKTVEREVVEAVNREQRRISYDLHDGLGQRLTGIALLLESASRGIRRQYPGATGDLDVITVQVRDTIQQIRALVHGVLPASLQHGELLPALRSLVEEISGQPDIVSQYDTDGWESKRLSAEAAQHVYRIAQEALNNARRHAQATQISLTLRADGSQLTLDVVDDGVGIPASSRDVDGIGLKIMDHRAQILGGTLSIESSPGKGTKVSLQCPIDSAAKRDKPFALKQGICECISASGIGRR
jgi:PAS domain S-box-containing protein